ncbi:hypothetical protein F2Q69_00048571 [Brassica cretica]|uniref:Uncharacterized protein n=1 Tax=Brassica cretica TaxID=69181 RepID=A0A8S9PDV6_BRACR|nr:hypothetical protein F2Q69_00048571 [Brassica cretica]
MAATVRSDGSGASGRAVTSRAETTAAILSTAGVGLGLIRVRRSEDGVRGGASGGDGDIDAMEVEQRLVVTEA